ncbi:MAG: glycosyltransferase family 4 protein [Gammaproteobacteria bacterium]|nr:glycosyltransferase family 4 protein [Gammaproteobacteria bacterium]
MKIAIVCDWLVTLGGAEKLIGQLLQCYPNADLFSVIDFFPKEERALLLNKQIKTTFIQKLPLAKTHYRTYLPLMPLAIEQLDLSDYDLIISSSHAVAKGILTGPQQLHISYIHSPMRYAWDLQHQYLKETGLDRKPQGMLARYFLHRLRLWDLRSANSVDYFVANSNFIAQRVMKTYRRESTVIYPPINLDAFEVHEEKENFYLTASRFVPYKRIDLIVESFRAMPDKKLIVIGDGPDFKKIQAKAPSNVSLLGYQDQPTLVHYLKRAKAFIFAAFEDFGLVPLEAQACGTPVIAYGKGGALETVRGLKHAYPTGLFFAEQTPASILEAVKAFEDNPSRFTPAHCRENAKQFSQTNFQKQFKQFVSEKCVKMGLPTPN